MQCNPPTLENYREEPNLQAKIDNPPDEFGWYGSYQTWQKVHGSKPEKMILCFAPAEACRAMVDGGPGQPGGRVLRIDYGPFEDFVRTVEDLKEIELPRFGTAFFRYLTPGDVVILNDDKIHVIPRRILNSIGAIAWDFHRKYGWLGSEEVAKDVREKILEVVDLLGERAINLDAAMQIRGAGFGNEAEDKFNVPGIIIRGGA